VVDAAATALGGFAALVDALPDATARREAFAAFVAARPQLWSDALVPELGDLPPQLLDTVCDRLLAEGRGDALVNRFRIFLLNPSRAPAAVLRLAKRWAAGLFEKIEGAPSLHDVTMGLLHLAETQAPLAARGDKPAKEIMRLLDEQLRSGKTSLLPRFVKAGGRGELAAAMGVLKRCKQMPDEIVAGLRAPVQERFPDLAPVEELPFWEGGAIYCSRDGLARRREEYRVLMHEKIPANAEDIGRAASYGDLSENFEWAAAIEQQRQLTEKAAAMEAELRLAQAIEDQKLPAGVVAPGTRVTFAQDGGASRTVSVLGPWDVGADVISYRAPLAAGMLGAKAGETVQVTLPSGAASIRVISIEAAIR
jgi:transcription elongation factor GreA